MRNERSELYSARRDKVDRGRLQEKEERRERRKRKTAGVSPHFRERGKDEGEPKRDDQRRCREGENQKVEEGERK